MERIKQLNRYQKGVLMVMIAMTLIFTALYPITISRVGFAYKDVILAASQENGGMVYAGKINWKQARFTVSAEKQVVFQYGETTYGPYTAKEFQKESGYNDVFIPAMRRLSPSYGAYYKALEEANEVFLSSCNEPCLCRNSDWGQSIFFYGTNGNKGLGVTLRITQWLTANRAIPLAEADCIEWRAL